MLWSFEGMLSKATTRVCGGGLDFCSLNIFRHFLWRLLGHHGGGLSWAQCFKKKFIRAGASFKLCRSILETFGEWDNGRGAEWGWRLLWRDANLFFYLIESASPASLASLEARLPSAEILIEPAGKRLLACGRKQPEPFFTGVCRGNCNEGIDRIKVGWNDHYEGVWRAGVNCK